MPIDLLAIGVANVVGLVFTPILEDFAKDVLRDTAKGYVRGCFGSVFSSLRQEPLQRALGKALRELLQLIQDELLDCGLTEDELEDWIPQVKDFTRSDGLQQALRELFTESDSRVDPSLLARSWEPFAGDGALPEGFSWQRIAGRFTRALRSLREQDAELRDILNTQATVETARAVRQQAGLAPDFDLDSYRQALLERYTNLHFQTLDTTGAYYSNVKLWSVFVPQSVRESREYYPQLLEVPKEHLRRMRERGDLDEAEAAIEEEIIEERRRSYLDQSPRPVLEVCGDDRIERLVIPGDPGSGKSSLLRYLALRWARIEDPNLLYTEPLPLLIELREYDRWQCASGKQLEQILRDYLKEKLNFPQPHAPARALVEQLRERNFILCYLGGDSYAFVHRTFLEYFCASAIVVRFRQKLSMSFLKEEVFGAHWKEETWHEVLCLIAGMIAETSVEQVAEIIEFLLVQRNDGGHEFHHVFLAARCYQEVPNPLSLTGLRQRLAGLIEKLLLFDFPFDYQDWLEPDLQQRRTRVRIKALIATSLLLSDPRLWFRRRAGEDGEWDVRIAALQELARGWKDDADTLPWLKDRAANDENEYVRRAAVQELARGWKDDADTLPWLKDCAANDNNYDVRSAAVQELARGWKDDADTLPLLKDRAANDENEYVRQAAVQELARGWKDDADTLPLLKDRAANDDHRAVRSAAVQELARGWQDDGDTLPLLKDRAANDDNWVVRRAAVRDLARGWKDDADTLPWLKDRAANDESSAVRRAALQELARGWKDDADTLPWLKDRAANDNNYVVRQAAVQELARGWQDDGDTLPLLKDRAANDDNWAVRRAAVQELARGWKDDADTLPLLKDRAANDDNWAVRRAAVQELERGWKDDPDAQAFL